MYFLARMEIMTNEDNINNLVTERAKLIGFDKSGQPFMKIDLEDLDDKQYEIVALFERHGTYLIIKDKN